MMQAHSLLWHYLWVTPSVLLLFLGGCLWRLNLHRRYPVFLAFALVSALEQLLLYACDLAPSVSPQTWWRVFWAGLIVEGLLKFALVGEIFAHVFHPYASVVKLAKFLIGAVGVCLVLTAAVAAAYAQANSNFSIVNGAHLLEQTVYLVESGLLTFIFLFAVFFSIRMAPPDLGIAVGLGISACVHLGTWAVAANTSLPEDTRTLLDFVNMATFQICVFVWFYSLLVPHRVTTPATTVLPENNLALWNRELERLLQP
jgi:hypothetical protein